MTSETDAATGAVPESKAVLADRGDEQADGSVGGGDLDDVDGADEPTPDDIDDFELVAERAVPPGGYGELEPERPPLIDDQGRVRLSFSRVNTYRTCPLQFRYSYIDRLPGKPSPHLSFGTAIHTALERLYDRKLPRWPDEDEFVSYLYDAWDTTGFAEMERAEQMQWYQHGQEVLRRFHRREQRRGGFELPVGTEVWFELPIGDEAVVVGSIDRVDVDEAGGFHIIDYKTGRKVRERNRVKRSLQLSLYALACRHLYGRLPASVCLDFVVAGVEIQVERDELDLDAARSAVLETARGVRQESFQPEPNNLCPWCDFRSLCPAWEGDGPEVLGPAEVELQRLRRSVGRDIARIRALEDGVERARAALDDDGPSALPGATDEAG